MNGFIYKGKSTASILFSSRLVLASFDTVDSFPGVSRESIKGEPTLTRPIPNEYGTKSDSLTFQYALVKENGKPFSDAEQVIVERWLTSPKLSSDLEVTDNNGMVLTTYCGKFINTEWRSCNGGWSGVIFDFECNSSYPYRHFVYDYDINGNTEISLHCISDELEEYIYPTLTVTVLSDTKSFSIINKTDDSNSMNITYTTKIPRNLPLIFDCKHCIPSDGTISGIISYADLGWKDIGNIYWLRLVPGINQLQINTTGSAHMSISFDAPHKKVGGWIS